MACSPTHSCSQQTLIVLYNLFHSIEKYVDCQFVLASMYKIIFKTAAKDNSKREN